MLTQGVHLKPGHTKWGRTTVNTSGNVLPLDVTSHGILIPSKDVCQSQCDFQEGFWNGNLNVTVPLTNWGNEPICIKKHFQVGKIEQVDLVTREAPHWNAELSDTKLAVRICQVGSHERNEQLKERLKIGDAVNEQQKEELISVLYSQVKHLHLMMMNSVRLVLWNTQLIPKMPHLSPPTSVGFPMH